MSINPELLRACKHARGMKCIFSSSATEALARARMALERQTKVYNDEWPWARGAHNVTRQRAPNEGYAWIENPSAAGLRRVGYADECVPRYSRCIDHKGWFINEFQDEVFRGVVYQLPGRDGRARYLAGYEDPWNAPAAFLSLDIIEGAQHCEDDNDAKRDAAISADEIARIFAEREREFQEVANARNRFDEIPDEITGIRDDVRKLCAQMRKARKACAGLEVPDLCAAIRADVRSLLKDVEKLRGERAKLESYYSHSPHWSTV
jgi:hypothetical protein